MPSSTHCRQLSATARRPSEFIPGTPFAPTPRPAAAARTRSWLTASIVVSIFEALSAAVSDRATPCSPGASFAPTPSYLARWCSYSALRVQKTKLVAGGVHLHASTLMNICPNITILLAYYAQIDTLQAGKHGDDTEYTRIYHIARRFSRVHEFQRHMHSSISTRTAINLI